MKRIKLIVLFTIALTTLTGCIGKMGPREKVKEFLNNYIKQDKSIIKELNDYLEKQDLTSEQKERYKNIIKSEYASLKYEIKEETIDGDKAKVLVDITVNNLYEASKRAEDDLLENPTNYYIDGNYSKNLFINHKLDLMEATKEKTTYTISLDLEKKDGNWILEDIDEDTLEKIHGIYNYEET